nr:hypothetical protein [Methanosarcina mazei]
MFRRGYGGRPRGRGTVGRCRHLSYELHDKEDSHKCGDDSHAPRPPEGATGSGADCCNSE